MKHPFHNVMTTRFKFRVMDSLLPKKHLGKVLDIGCGAGYIIFRLDKHFDELYGIDMSEKSIALAKTLSRANFQVANAEKLPFSDAMFDCVVSTDAFEHIPDDKAAVKEVKRVLKPGGTFAIYVPTTVGLFSKSRWVDLFHTDQTSYLLDQRYYTEDSLKSLVQGAGFQVIAYGYHDVFFQELFTQFLKWIGFKLGKQYAHQADIGAFTQSKLYKIYRYLVFPVIFVLVRTEELICEKIFRSKIPGHRLFMVCRS